MGMREGCVQQQQRLYYYDYRLLINFHMYGTIFCLYWAVEQIELI